MEWKDCPDDAQLFADWQVSKTEIMLIEMLRQESDDKTLYQERYDGNVMILETIEGILRSKYSTSGIEGFLKNGYCRAVEISEPHE